MIGKNHGKQKKDKLRYNEYYGTQEMFDDLYRRAKEGQSFYDLYDLIIDKRNIGLAYRSIKSNRGSTTRGTNLHTIKNIKDWTEEQVV